MAPPKQQPHVFGTKTATDLLDDDSDTDSLTNSCSHHPEQDGEAEDPFEALTYDGILPKTNTIAQKNFGGGLPMKTFNFMINQSSTEEAENISARGILASELVRRREQRRRPSDVFHDFAKARASTFTRNVEFAHAQAITLTRDISNAYIFEAINLSRDSHHNIFDNSSSSLFGAGPTRPVERFQTIQFDDLRKSMSMDYNGGELDQEPSYGVVDFFNDRIDTFTRNVDFLQRTTGEWTQSIASSLRGVFQ
jgi:hypothetical protein